MFIFYFWKIEGLNFGIYRDRKSGQAASRQHASRPEALPLDFVVRPQSKIDPEQVRERAKQVMHDQRRLKVGSSSLLNSIFIVCTVKYHVSTWQKT